MHRYEPHTHAGSAEREGEKLPAGIVGPVCEPTDIEALVARDISDEERDAFMAALTEMSEAS